MNAIWFGFILYALVEAIAAGYRVYQKRRTLAAQPTAPQTGQLSSRSLPQPTPTTVQLDPDLDRAAYAPLTQAANQAANQPNVTEPDVALAASLSVNELVHSGTPANPSDAVDLNLETAEFAHPGVEPAKSEASEHQSVLAEISQLNDTDSDHAIAQLQPLLHHPDDMVRVAIVVKLEEIAAKQNGKAAEAKEMLMQLSQDANPDVRNQAVLALTKIDPIVSND